MEVEFPFQNIMRITDFLKWIFALGLLEEFWVDHCEVNYLGPIN